MENLNSFSDWINKIADNPIDIEIIEFEEIAYDDLGVWQCTDYRADIWEFEFYEDIHN